MITFSKLEKKGHLGNQLFQIASTIGIAKANNQEFCFKPWKYQNYFKNPLPLYQEKNYQISLEKAFEYHSWDLKDKDFDIDGWLQTEKYFDVAKTKHYFEFKDELEQKIKNLYSEAFKKETILLSVRRGDFVNHPDYFQTPIKFYLGALVTYFKDILNYNLIVLSDDVDYCKYHFSALPNTFFSDKLHAIEQLCLGSLCDHFIISNSTFSWWSAWLGEKKHSKIITPIQNFRGEKAKELNDKDYFPQRWASFNFNNFKHRLDTQVYLKNNPFLNPIQTQLLEHFFTCSNGISINTKNNSASDNLSQLVIADVIPSPIHILQLAEASKKQINASVYANNKVAVNYQLGRRLFQDVKDFGIYSSIFSFSNNKASRQLCLKIVNKLYTTEITYNTKLIGSFSKLLGYKFFIKKAIRKNTILIKTLIKTILDTK